MNPFLWLSGADPELIHKCGDAAYSEKGKFIGFGTTVLIPAVYGGLAAGYAISTFVDYSPVYIFGGLLWFLTILAIDRFLVSTLYKSRVHSRKEFWFALSARLTLAVVLGFVIAHPLVMFLFRDSIEKQAIADRSKDFIAAVGNIEDEISNKFKNDIELIAGMRATLTCRESLLSSERTGAKVNLPCGSTTGLLGDKKISQKVDEENKKLKAYIETLESKLTDKTKGYQAQKDEITRVFDIATKQNELPNKPKFDYLSRTKALQHLTEKKSHLWWAYHLLILALIIIDSLLVILKATTSIGPYELERDTVYQQIEILSDSRIEAFREHSSEWYTKLVKLQLLIEAKKQEMEMPRDLIEELARSEPARQKKFEGYLKHFGIDISDPQLMKLRQLYRDAYEKAIEKIREVLRS